ncbi:hypothetical protein BKA69DRAFT_685763 [Paraphysoderma sedebokerense]|nr:hypothetical protein BKA69DRAFT_685763 [Paraphysoderma sedebokerense]
MSTTVVSRTPLDYVPPEWPSLYDPLSEDDGTSPRYMYNPNDIFRFTLYWMLLLYSSFYGIAGCWAYIVFLRRSKWAVLFPVLFILIGVATAAVFGTVFGFVLSAVYNAGAFKMSVWTPFLWSLLQCLITLIGSYTQMSTYL